MRVGRERVVGASRRNNLEAWANEARVLGDGIKLFFQLRRSAIWIKRDHAPVRLPKHPILRAEVAQIHAHRVGQEERTPHVRSIALSFEAASDLAHPDGLVSLLGDGFGL